MNQAKGKAAGLRIALFSGNYNITRDGANKALSRLVRYLIDNGAQVRIYSPTVKNGGFEAVGDLVERPRFQRCLCVHEVGAQGEPARRGRGQLGPDDGDPFARIPLAIGRSGAHVHWYGKESRPGRKIGHVTARADSAAEAEASATAACLVTE